MMIAIGILVALVVVLSQRSAPDRLNRADKRGLEHYERKARREGTFPYDYLSR